MALPSAAPADDNLIARIRDGDEAAFAALFRRHNRALRLYAARVHGQAGTSEEIVQEVFFRLWSSRARLQVTGSITGYLYAAVRNYAINQYHRARREQRWQQREILALGADAALASESVDDDVHAAELAAAIDRAVAELPPRCRQAFVLRRQHHLSYAEIARAMQIAPKTVEIQIGNALRLLRRALVDWI